MHFIWTAGGKGQGSHDGGIRVPTIMKWPGKVKAGHVVDEPVSLMDVFPTVARALRVRLPPSLVVDGRDLTELVTGREKVSPHEFMMHYCQGDVHAVRYRPRQGQLLTKFSP
jgi:arylsulfatase A-like enzyme